MEVATVRSPEVLEESPEITSSQAEILADLIDTSFAAFGTEDVLELADKDNKRSEDEIRELKQRIALIARVFSGNYDLEVIPSPQGGWACGVDPKGIHALERYVRGEIDSIDELDAELFEPTQILYDLKDIEQAPEDEVLGVLRHEVGHAKHSDYRLLFKGQRRAREEGYLPSSWAQIQNALEDPWINNLEIADSEVVREQMHKMYAARTPEILQKIGTQPASHQLGLNIIYYWMTGESIPTLENKEVLEIFERIRPQVDAYFKGATAQENFDLLGEDIWPEYQKLEQKALDDEALKEAARKLSGQNLGKGKLTQQQGGGMPSNEGGAGISGFLATIKKALGFADDGEDADEDQQAGLDEAADELKEQASRSTRKQVKEELQRQAKALQEADKGLEEQGEESGSLPDDINLDQIPKELLEELEQAVQNLPAEAQEALKKEARKQLDRRNAQKLRRDAPRSMSMKQDKQSGEYQMQPERQQAERLVKRVSEQVEQVTREVARIEQLAKQDEVQQEQRIEEVIQQEMEEIRQDQERQMMGFEGEDLGLYSEFKRLETSMGSNVRRFVRQLRDYLPKKQEFEHQGAHYTGTKLDRKALARRVPVGDYRLLKRRSVVQSPDPRLFVTLLIDNSGSMAGQKMEESLKTAIFLARVLKKFNIPFAIKFFGDHVESIKKFQQDYDQPTHRIMPKLIRKADASGSFTNISAPIEEAYGEMKTARKDYPDSHGAIWVITDSGANRGKVGDELKRLIQEVDRTFSVMNFILSDYDAEVKVAEYCFGERNVVSPATFHELPQEAYNALKRQFQRILTTR